MDFKGNFFPVSLDSRCIEAAYSLPEEPGSGFGKHPGKLAVGTAGDFRAYGYVRFQVGASFAKNFDSTYVFERVEFVFDTLYDTTLPVVGSITSATKFHLYRCDSTTADNLIPGSIPDTALCTLEQVFDDDDSAHWSGTLTDSLLADSIFCQCRQALSCYNETDGSSSEKIVHCDSTLPIDFFFALCSTGDSLVWFKSTSGSYPAMVIHAHYPDGDSTISTTDTLRGYPTLVASEADPLITDNALQPLASWLPGRTTVFKIDLQTLWDTMKTTGFTELLSAGFVASTDLLSTEDDDTMPPVNYFLSSDYNDSIDWINEQFTEANTYYSPVVYLNAPSDSPEVVLPIDYHLQHYINGKKRYFYLYIRLVSANVTWNQEVLWSNPRFKAVLTPTK